MKALLLAAACTLLASGAMAQAPEANGIHVSGTWTLEVRAADGTPVRGQRFHNDLTADGARYLLGILARETVHGALSVRVLSANGPCDDGNGGRSACILREPGAAGDDAGVTEELVFSIVPAADGLPQRLRYTGSVSAGFDDSITEVQSWFAQCDYGDVLACDAANASISDAFTSRVLGAPLEVRAGQTVDVTFELSFD